MKTSSKYRIHRTLAILVVPLLLLSTATGFFRANQKWFWEEGYKKKKQKAELSFSRDLVPAALAMANVDSLTKQKNKYEEVILRSEGGAPYYLLTISAKKKYLADAYTGEVVSPISKELASSFSHQYVKVPAAIQSVERLASYKPRKAREAREAWKISFDNAIHSEVYLDAMSGEIMEDIDDTRTFYLWVMRMHDYDYFNMKKEISSAVGIGIFLVAISGVWIYRFRSKKKS